MLKVGPVRTPPIQQNGNFAQMAKWLPGEMSSGSVLIPPSLSFEPIFANEKPTYTTIF